MIGVNQSSGAMVVRYLVGNDVLPGYEVPAGSNRTLPPPTSGVVRSALIFNNDCELVTVAVFTTGPASFAGGGQLFITPDGAAGYTTDRAAPAPNAIATERCKDAEIPNDVYSLQP